jgi:ferritin-like metal-binding protein YciE
MEAMVGQPWESLRDYFIDAVRDIYWAEIYFTKTLPKMRQGARSDELKEAFDRHLKQTERHVSELEELFSSLKISTELKSGESIIGILSEAEDVLDEHKGDSLARDLRLIFAGRKAEHYEISVYGGLIALSARLRLGEAAHRMNRILADEKAADEKLKGLAARYISGAATRPGEGKGR